MILINFLTGFLSGVALRSITHMPQIFITALFLASLFSLIYVRRKNTFILYMLMFFLAAAAGIMRFNAADQAFESSKSMFEKTDGIFTGIIDEIPVEGDYNISARTRTEYGNVLLRIEKGNELSYGDKVSVRAQCKIPEDFETNTGTTFDYDRYLMARDMHHVCKAYSFETVEKDAGGFIQGRLYELRQWFSGHIDGAFKDPHAGLVRGVLLGDKSGLSSELKSEMTVAGVIHIAVLSGSNIALVAAIIFSISKSFHYNARIMLSVTIVVLFVLLSGAEPPAVRAGILVGIMFLGKFLHRDLHTGRALLVIAFIMVAWNPFALIYDMSFQLSFLATIGIMYVAPVLEKHLYKVTKRCGLRDVIAGTLGAQIAVTPLLLYATGSFSIVSLPANVVIGWAVPVLMSIGFFGGMLQAVSSFIALPVVFLAELVSGYIISITKVSAHLPYAQILVPLDHPLILCGMYLGLFLVLKSISRPDRSDSHKVSN